MIKKWIVIRITLEKKFKNLAIFGGTYQINNKKIFECLTSYTQPI